MSGGKKTADAVVVGGGIVGSMCAYYLARAGLRPVVVERGSVAGGTSGCCMGHLMVVPKPPLMAQLTYRSVRLWHAIAAEVGGFEHNPCGALWLAESDEDLELLNTLETMLNGLGEAGRMLRGPELHEFEPGIAPDLHAGFYFPVDGVVMPMLAAGAVLRDAVGRGARVLPQTDVLGVDRDPQGRVSAVRTSAGAIDTPIVINAAGVWASGLTELVGLGVAPIHPRRGDLAITMPREVPVRHQLLEVGYLRTTKGSNPDPTGASHDPGANALNVQPQSHGTCLIGSTRQFVGPNRVVNRQLLDQSLRRAVRFVPELAGARLTRTWAGLRPFTTDGLPIIGPTRVPGFWMAAGHEGLGITLGPITGQLIADAITGAADDSMLGPLALDRFAEVPSV